MASGSAQAEKFLFAWLKQETAVTDLLGTGDSIRAFPDAAKQDGPFPVVVWNVISDPTRQSLGGPESSTLVNVQIDCYAETKAGAVALADAIQGDGAAGSNQKLDGYTSAVDGALGGVWCHVARCTNRQNLIESPQDATGVPLFRVTLDFEFDCNR